MKLHQSTAEIFVPDGKPVVAALKRIMHSGIGAHQDDLGFMAFHGILNCFTSVKKWFGGARTGAYKHFTDAQMMAVRRREQNVAAMIGRHGVMLQLNYPGSAVKRSTHTKVIEDLKEIITATRPKIVYTHNLADKHETHTSIVIAALQVLRELPRGRLPQKIIGCKMWRNLDWLPDADKVLMDVSGSENLAAALNGVFDSQISGGKRYDSATTGRRAANATFFESHATDKTSQLIFGMDLAPLVTNEAGDIADYACRFIKKFEVDAREKLTKRLG